MKPATFAPVYLTLFPRLSDIANKYGYALAAHGSLQRDMDLVAIPWTVDAKDQFELIEAFRNYLMTFCDIFSAGLHGPERKAHGRLAWMIQTGLGSAIDLSVMPRIMDGPNAETTQTKDLC